MKNRDEECKSLKKKNKLSILAIGDSNVGKTTFLSSYSNWVNDLNWSRADQQQLVKVQQTIGCDIHVCTHVANYRSLMSENDKYYVQFWDLAGENKQREFVNVFTKDRLQKLDAIIFFFDATNLNTFSNLYKWLVTIFHNSVNKKNYACVWNLPFLLIGTKTDLIPKKYVLEIKQKLLSSLNKMFRCTRGENLLFMNAKVIDSPSQNVELSMFNLFLSQLCIEKQLKLQVQDQGQSEYKFISQAPSMNKDLCKYRLNRDNYKNKRLIEEDKNFVQIVMEVNQLGEYQKEWWSQVTRISSKIAAVKNKFMDLIFSKKKSEQEINEQTLIESV